jgi:RNA-directed DNA polymerase
VNRAKTRVARRGARQEVTGVTVNEVAGLSRRERRRVRALAHQVRMVRESGTPEPAREAELAGKLAYLAMLNPAQAAALRRHTWPGTGGATS